MWIAISWCVVGWGLSYKYALILSTHVLFTNPRLSLTSEINIPVFLDPLMLIISHAHPQLRHPSPHSPIIVPTTFSLSSSTPYVNAPSSLGRGSGSGGFLLQHSGEPHALRTLRNAVAVNFHPPAPGLNPPHGSPAMEAPRRRRQGWCPQTSSSSTADSDRRSSPCSYEGCSSMLHTDTRPLQLGMFDDGGGSATQQGGVEGQQLGPSSRAPGNASHL